MKADAIRDLIQRLLAAAQREGSFTESIALQVEQQFRQEYRGDTIYIKATAESINPDEVRQRYLNAEPVDTITEGMGISRAHMYRLLKK